MSSNNFIRIHKEELEWCVEHKDADTGALIEDLGSWADLESAIQCANSFMENETVEYGLDITL